MSENERRTKAETAKMLRHLRYGDRVAATVHTNNVGTGTVIEAEPFSTDGVRRVRVSWDNGPTVKVLPASIVLLDPKDG